MKKKMLFAIFCILMFSAAGPQLFAQHQHGAEGTQKGKAAETKKSKKVYTCPMHPQVVSDKPGKCPLCGMNLSEVVAEKGAQAEGAQSEAAVRISKTQQQLIGLETEPVLYRPLTKVIRTVAVIAFDPELYKSEQELIQALKIREDLRSGSSPESAGMGESLVAASELKLKLQGLSEGQIAELKSRSEGDRGLLISDTKTPYVWAYVTLYEYDLGLVSVGDHITLKSAAYPTQEFGGEIKAMDPVLDPATRSVRVRTLVANPEGKLKPNMYMDAFIHIDLGTQLAVAREAVLDTGLRKVVYLDAGDGQFTAREVEVGPEAAAVAEGEERRFYPVLKGLKENDVAVTKGNFLIDSQSQLTGGMSALWGGSTEIKTEHKH